jgi:hypothetical protein
MEKSFINWRVLSLVKIITRISDTPCISITSIEMLVFSFLEIDETQLKINLKRGNFQIIIYFNFNSVIRMCQKASLCFWQ